MTRALNGSKAHQNRAGNPLIGANPFVPLFSDGRCQLTRAHARRVEVLDLPHGSVHVVLALVRLLQDPCRADTESVIANLTAIDRLIFKAGFDKLPL